MSSDYVHAQFCPLSEAGNRLYLFPCFPLMYCALTTQVFPVWRSLSTDIMSSVWETERTAVTLDSPFISLWGLFCFCIVWSHLVSRAHNCPSWVKTSFWSTSVGHFWRKSAWESSDTKMHDWVCHSTCVTGSSLADRILDWNLFSFIFWWFHSIVIWCPVLLSF